jgi:hypothetical protein
MKKKIPVFSVFAWTALIIAIVFICSMIFFMTSAGIRNLRSAQIQTEYYDRLEQEYEKAIKEQSYLMYTRGYDDAITDLFSLNKNYFRIHNGEMTAKREQRFSQYR